MPSPDAGVRSCRPRLTRWSSGPAARGLIAVFIDNENRDVGMWLRRLRRERDRIERQLQEAPSDPRRHETEDLLRRLDALIRRLESDEVAVRSVLDDECAKAARERAGRERRGALVALITALAALLGHSVSVPADASEEELQGVVGLLHGLFVQQLMQDLGYTAPVAFVAGALHPWLCPLPDPAPSLSEWRSGARGVRQRVGRD